MLEAQALMARDPDLATEVARHIAAGSTAARAVYDAFGTYRTVIAAAGGYIAGRVADLVTCATERSPGCRACRRRVCPP